MHGFHEGYYDYGNLKQPSQTRSEFTKALEALEAAIPAAPTRSIFDIGYGNGFFLAIAKSRGWEVDGIDSSPKNADIAKSKFGLKLRHGSFSDFKPESKRYDAVSIWDVVEHIPDPSPFLKKAEALLKPNGRLLIGVPNDDSLMAHTAHAMRRLSGGLVKFPLRKLYFLEHVSYYNLSSLTRLLQRNGFQRERYFLSSTDMKKYALPAVDRAIAGVFLHLGRALGLENRLVAVFSKKK